jgi:hypothetical protein
VSLGANLAIQMLGGSRSAMIRQGRGLIDSVAAAAMQQISELAG